MIEPGVFRDRSGLSVDNLAPGTRWKLSPTATIHLLVNFQGVVLEPGDGRSFDLENKIRDKSALSVKYLTFGITERSHEPSASRPLAVAGIRLLPLALLLALLLGDLLR